MICRNCGFVGAEAFSICPRCGNNISQPEADEPLAQLSGQCSNCGGSFDFEILLYCPACGALNFQKANDESVVCDLHIENRAIGFCVVCGKAVCEECAESSGKKILCTDSAHREFLDKWKVVHKFDFEYEAAMLYANLEQQGIETQVFTKLNPNSIDVAVRPTIVEVLVPYRDEDAAAEVIELLGLSEEEENET
ncbi:MAG: B-box zinc finger protein [Candidatus Kryptoniota bacterium]